MADENQGAGTGPINASEAVQKFALEKGIDLATLEGTGKNGAILKGDVEKAVKERDGDAQEGEAAEEAPRTYRAHLTGTLPFGAVDVPGCSPTVVIGRTPTVISAETKAAIEQAIEQRRLPLSTANVVIEEVR